MRIGTGLSWRPARPLGTARDAAAPMTAIATAARPECPLAAQSATLKRGRMSRKFLIAAFISCLIVAPSADARPTQLMPGVSYERVLRWTATGPIALYVVTAPKPGGFYTLSFFFSSRRRHTRLQGDWSSDVCSSD